MLCHSIKIRTKCHTAGPRHSALQLKSKGSVTLQARNTAGSAAFNYGPGGVRASRRTGRFCLILTMCALSLISLRLSHFIA